MINNLNLITDTDTAEELQSEIIDGEKVLWAGKPQNGPVLRKKDIVNMLILLAICGFLGCVLFSKEQFHFTLWIVIIIAGLLYELIGRFVVKKRIRLGTGYGITKAAVIVKTRQNFDTYHISELSEISLIEYKDGIGTIVLGPNTLKFYMLPGMYRLQGSYEPSPRLEYINNARVVFDLLLSLNPDITGKEDKYFWY